MAPATTLGSHSCAKTQVWWIHRQSRWWSKNLGDGWHGGAVTALFRLKTQVMGPSVTLGPNHIVKTRVWHIHCQSRRWSINFGGGRHLVNNRVKVRVWGLWKEKILRTIVMLNKKLAKIHQTISMKKWMILFVIQMGFLKPHFSMDLLNCCILSTYRQSFWKVLWIFFFSKFITKN